jgi:hypothetical protein
MKMAGVERNKFYLGTIGIHRFRAGTGLATRQHEIEKTEAANERIVCYPEHFSSSF